MVEETAKETLSLLFPATNATICLECGLSESKTSRSLLIRANGIAVQEGKTNDHSQVGNSIVEVGKGAKQVASVRANLTTGISY